MPFVCPHCAKTLGSSIALRQHMRDKHDDDRFPCAACDETFLTQDDLERHEAYVHKIIKCPRCQCSVGTIAALQSKYT